MRRTVQSAGMPNRSNAEGTGSFLADQAAVPADHPARDRRIDAAWIKVSPA
jgi:hypothetical protein